VIMTAFLAEKIVTVLTYSILVGKMTKEFQGQGDTCRLDECFRTDLKDMKK